MGGLSWSLYETTQQRLDGYREATTERLSSMTAELRTRDWKRKKNSNQTVHHGVKLVDERSGLHAKVTEITWPHINASKLEVQLNLLPLEVHILEEM